MGMLRAPLAAMILAPRYLPRLAATVGLFTRYGLLDFARGQGLLALEGVDAATIAEITGLTAGNVATKTHRIKHSLARQLRGKDTGHE